MNVCDNVSVIGPSVSMLKTTWTDAEFELLMSDIQILKTPPNRHSGRFTCLVGKNSMTGISANFPIAQMTNADVHAMNIRRVAF
jgi:hypothetical protein